MKVYIVCSMAETVYPVPKAVFSTLDRAMEWKKKYDRYDNPIFEWDVDIMDEDYIEPMEFP